MIRWFIAVVLLLIMPVAGATNIVIVNKDAPGEGLNDPTPREPVGGNPGDTLGEQRLYTLLYATQILESRLVSTATIRIAVKFEPLNCSYSNALIGSGGARYLVSNFDQAPRPDTLYPIALANALAGRRLDIAPEPYADIVATFSSTIDNPEYAHCLAGGDWYYGFDGQTPEGDVNFLNTVIHEFIHGLGFQSFVDFRTGHFLKGRNGQRMPDIFSAHIMALSLPLNPLWPELTAGQREQTMTSGKLVWDPVIRPPGGSSYTWNAVARLDHGKINGRIKLYAPASLQVGSSISHVARAVSPDQLMEPFKNNNTVLDGLGLAVCILNDIGWRLAGGVRCPDDDPVPPFRLSRIGQGSDVVDSDTGNASRDGNDDDDDSGGGGCTMNPNAAFDPMLAGLVFLALGVLGWRRRRTGGI